MKVAIIVPVFITGGAENMAAQLAVHLDKSQVDVEVISIYPRQGHPFEKKIEDAGIPIHYMDKRGHASPGAMIRLWKCLSKMKPDVVHTHIYATFYAIPWVLTHKAVQVHTIHSCPGNEFPGVLDKVLSGMSKMKKMVLAAVSEKNRELARDYYNAPESRVFFVNNPVDLERFRPGEAAGRKGVTFINVGRQDENKNQVMAIRAMQRVLSRVPGARLVLVGSGPCHGELKQTVRQLALENAVEILGECGDPERLLAEADVYLSTSFHEGLPLSMLEAEAAGLPVIATCAGGVVDIVRENGVLIPPGDQEALETQMLRFAEDPQLRRRCAAASLEIVKQFDANACAERYTQIYEQFCPGKRAE